MLASEQLYMPTYTRSFKSRFATIPLHHFLQQLQPGAPGVHTVENGVILLGSFICGFIASKAAIEIPHLEAMPAKVHPVSKMRLSSPGEQLAATAATIQQYAANFEAAQLVKGHVTAS